MKHIKYILALAFLLFACSDDNSTEPVEKSQAEKFFPLAVGNYWVFETANLNQSFEKYGPFGIDSLVVVNAIGEPGSRVFEIRHFRDGEIYDTIQVGIAGNTILSSLDAEKLKIPELPDQLFAIADFDSDDWNLHVIFLEDVQEKYNDKIVQIDYHFTMNASFIWQNTEEIFGENLPAAHFNMKNDMKAGFEFSFGDTLNYSVQRTRLMKRNYDFAEGIGWYRIQNQPYRLIEKSNYSKFQPQNKEYPGKLLELIRYNISED